LTSPAIDSLALTLPLDLTSLIELNLYDNLLTDISFPGGLIHLRTLNLGRNLLTSFTLPAGLTDLTTLNLYYNDLTSLKLPGDLSNLRTLEFGENLFTYLSLPVGLTSLKYLYLRNNQLLATLVLREPLTTGVSIVPSLQQLQATGVTVHPYSVEATLTAGSLITSESFTFTLFGPPGAYQVQVASDFSTWTNLGFITNALGSAEFNDLTAGQRSHSFYQVKLEP
jgi:Leucine Rich repeats (2 copies)